ncbi:MAG: hypothetical protein QGG67_11325 [Gammaproteobacteria bacterium]|nr:hypothetical protein [Gammaproteobacteria bacterium]HJO12610.1 hypothetical protein [Gammaproteobacteria bacterium]
MGTVSNWVNVGSAVGVLMGIVFLGWEVRQNTEMMKSQARDAITEKQMMYSEWVATEPEMAEAVSKLCDGMDSMTPRERIMIGYFLAGVWREWENSYYQYQSGLFEQSKFEPRMGRWQSQMATEATQTQWCGQRQWFAPDFREEVDRIVRASGEWPCGD